MKRNMNTVTAGRRVKAGGRSKYATKVASGNQLYGPGCCAHTRTAEQIAKGKAEAAKRGHFAGYYSQKPAEFDETGAMV